MNNFTNRHLIKAMFFALLLLTASVKLQAQCTATFGIIDSMGQVAFFNYSTGNDLWAQWSFGDGSYSYDWNPYHSYQQGGTYTVCLFITDSIGSCQDSTCQTITVSSGNPNCSAYFYYSNVDSFSNDTSGLNFYFYGYTSQNINEWYWDFGDGTTATTQNPYHAYANAGIYNVCLVGVDNVSGCADTVCQTVYVGDLSGLYGYVSGTVYLDLNGNCVQDSGETGIPNLYVSLSGNQYDGAYTDANGNYTFGALPGTYSITVYPGYYFSYTQVCPAGSISVTLSTGATSSGNDFYLKPKGTGQDLSVSMYCWGFRPGFTSGSWITYCNDGGITMNGTVEFVHDANLTLSVADSFYNWYYPAPDNYDAGAYTATWNYSNLLPGECRYLYVALEVPSTLALGTMVNNSVTIFPANGDATVSNNSAACADSVRGSYDPNEKHVTPEGTGTQGYIDPATTTLTYRINFQNTGTAEAYTVVVRDTLDVNVFDLSSVSALGAKHNFTADIEDNTLKFIFNNIMLPDSNTNEPASHGFVTYTVNLKPGLPVGTQIKNSASIYFDFNAPVQTNTTVNTLGFPLGIRQVTANREQMSIQPNPFTDHASVTYSLEKNAAVTAELYNIIGEKVAVVLNHQYKTSGHHQLTLNSRQLNLQEGIYLVKFNIDGKVATKKVSVAR